MAVLPEGSRLSIVTDLYPNIKAKEFETDAWVVCGWFDTAISTPWLFWYTRVAANGRHLIAGGCQWIGIQSKHLLGGWDWRKSQTVSVMTTQDLAGHLPKTIGPHSTHTSVVRTTAVRMCFCSLREQRSNGQFSWFEFSRSEVHIWT